MELNNGGAQGGRDALPAMNGGDAFDSNNNGNDVYAIGGVVLKKGPWTAAEDAVLLEYVTKHGEGKWNMVQKNSGLARCGKSCRLRWANHLRPNLKQGEFTPEEEKLIVELHAKYGNKWSRIAALLPGRTDNSIKNYWHTRVKRRRRQGLPLYPPDVQPESANHSLHPQYYCSAPATPTSSFSFPTPSATPTCSTPPPLSCPTTTNFPTLPLFEFPVHRSPPILQTPLRFKRLRRDYSSPSIFSPSLPPLSQSSAALLPQSSPASPFVPGSDSLSSLLPAVGSVNDPALKPQELPSNQFLLPQTIGKCTEIHPFNAMENDGNEVVSRKRKRSDQSELLEYLLRETHAFGGCDEGCNSGMQNCLAFEGVSGQWDDLNFVSLSSASKSREESANQISDMHEDLTKLLNAIPSTVQVSEFYSNGGEISNGESSVLTNGNIHLEMQQLGSFFPVASLTDYGRTSDFCSWDNLPRIC